MIYMTHMIDISQDNEALDPNMLQEYLNTINLPRCLFMIPPSRLVARSSFYVTWSTQQWHEDDWYKSQRENDQDNDSDGFIYGKTGVHIMNHFGYIKRYWREEWRCIYIFIDEYRIFMIYVTWYDLLLYTHIQWFISVDCECAWCS